MDLSDAAVSALELAERMRKSIGEAITTSEELSARLDRIPTRLGPYGVDPFGFDPQYVQKVIGFAEWAYRSYFRCDTYGIENIPDGRCLMIANHSGQLPYDGAMITAAAFLEREPPRFLRSMVERFVPRTPFVSTFLARCGQILGTPDNCKRLLEAGEGILVFPEGVRGVNKSLRHRYKLQRFGQGFMRLALETNTPIVPVAVIGAEEQMPGLFSIKAFSRFTGIPQIPVTPFFPLLGPVGLLPLPTKYRIYFGEPLRFEGHANDEDEVILQKAEVVRQTIQRMVDDGVKKRRGIFW